LVVRKLGDSSEMTREQAGARAFETAQKYIAKYKRELAKRDAMSEDELEELRNTASFPRPVVAKYVRKILPTLESGEKGVTAFIEQSGIGQKEFHRILNSEDRISVSITVADHICCSFGLNFIDLIIDSEEWATKTGDWKDRDGARDPWPVGYTGRHSGGEDFEL
jgi:hypothetical protein